MKNRLSRLVLNTTWGYLILLAILAWYWSQ
jgi:hypothetical protein